MYGRVAYIFVPFHVRSARLRSSMDASVDSGAHGAGIATLSPRALEPSLPPIPEETMFEKFLERKRYEYQNVSAVCTLNANGFSEAGFGRVRYLGANMWAAEACRHQGAWPTAANAAHGIIGRCLPPLNPPSDYDDRTKIVRLC